MPKLGFKHSIESRMKIRLSLLGKPGRNTGNFHTEETKKKLSESHKGQKAWNKGLKTPEEVRIKLRLSHLGKKRSPEALAKARETFKRKYKEGWKPVEGKTWKLSEESRLSHKLAAPQGEDSYKWKGDDAGYSAIHKWIKSHLVSPKKCEHCLMNDDKRLNWANRDHNYKRSPEDWLRLCPKCHKKYDLEVGNYGRTNKKKNETLVYSG